MGCHDFWFKKCWHNISKGMNLIFHDLLRIILEIYVDNVIVKSDNMNNHLADLRLALERMCRYELKMNLLNVCSVYRLVSS
jgi:hypothetical protein